MYPSIDVSRFASLLSVVLVLPIVAMTSTNYVRRRHNAAENAHHQYEASSRGRYETQILSTSEQDETLLELARDIRFSTMLLRMVACMHIVFALLYVCLLFYDVQLFDLASSPSALVQVSKTNTNQGQRAAHANTEENGAISRTWSKRAGRNGMGGAAHENAHYKSIDRDQGTTDSQVGAFDRHDKPSSLTSSRVLAQLISILLCAVFFVLGGCTTWSSHRRLRINIDDLVSQPARQPGASTERTNGVHSTPATFAQNTLQNRASEAHSPESTTPPPAERFWALSFSSVYAHMQLSVLSSLVSLFWLVHVYLYPSRAPSYMHNGAIEEAPGPASYAAYSFSVAHNLAQVVVIAWQPCFHFYVAYMIQSLHSVRDKLLTLSHMKYALCKY